MRSFTLSFLTISACSGSARPIVSDFRPAIAAAPAPPAQAEPAGLHVVKLRNPISQASVRFLAPRAFESMPESEVFGYELRFRSDRLDPDMLGIDLALDAHRPRRVPVSASSFRLGQLLALDESVLPGEHWLFAAPISASGLVPERAPGGGRSATATRFWVGAGGPSASASGVVWLRKPDGTYNGAHADQILFDAELFGSDGAALPAACELRILGPMGAAKQQTSSPFIALALASGEYALTALLPGVAPVEVRFTVNRELGGVR